MKTSGSINVFFIKSISVRFGGCALKLRLVVVACLLALLAPAPGVSEPLSLSTKSRTTLFESQLQFLDDRALAQRSISVRLQPPRAIVPGTPEAIALAGGYAGPFLDLARAAAMKNGVPEHLYLRLVLQESGWNASAVSAKGAIGLAQLMPATARKLGVNALDPADNLDGGARYLRQMFDRFGSWRLALAAYNAGPEAVQKYRGVPPFSETNQYLTAILGG